jgi:hypothetical protein
MCQLVPSLLQTYSHIGLTHTGRTSIQVSGRGASTTIVASDDGLIQKGHDVKIGLRDNERRDSELQC